MSEHLRHHRDGEGRLIIDKAPAYLEFTHSYINSFEPGEFEIRLTIRAENGIFVYQVDDGDFYESTLYATKLIEELK